MEPAFFTALRWRARAHESLRVDRTYSVTGHEGQGGPSEDGPQGGGRSDCSQEIHALEAKQPETHGYFPK